MAASTGVLKVEVEAESCCVCGRAGGEGELVTAEEYDAGAPPVQVPLRSMMLHLNNNKVIPEGRLCMTCVQRATEAYEFSSSLSSRSAPPLSEKIRALRRRLHELTQKIDVFIVVGGPGAGGGAGAYSEDDIIMVEKEALAAAAAADDEDLEHARNARGDNVYQCTVCPLSFQRVGEYRSHARTHPAGALHSCWTCGAQAASRAALALHAAEHAPAARACHLCRATFSSQSEQRRHEAGAGAGGACAPRCPAPACQHLAASRGALAAHVSAAHGRGAPPPHVCPSCFRTFPEPALLSAHMLRHRQDKQFVCGYADCVLRFPTRNHLMAHIRKCHSAELPAEPAETPAQAQATTCETCNRTFGSAAAMKRHARVHREVAAETTETAETTGTDTADNKDAVYEQYEQFDTQHVQEEVVTGMDYSVEEGEVEYLEVETLEEAEGEGEAEGVAEYEVEGEYELKPEIA